ncbi:MAG: hypothetical protein GEV07_02080 [Streptosporangiales bacterium]|nr:hypothetical protein [Streptosporangiales bacterium]
MAVVSYRALAARVLTLPARLGPVRLVGVDGPTGSGKSTFAGRLADALRSAGSDVTLLHTDDLLDGWADTVTFWPRLESWVLAPLRDGKPGGYRPYDWYAGAFGADWTQVPATGVLILDGVTSTRRAAAPDLTLAVWMSMQPSRSLARAIDRDGEAMAGELTAWHDREQAHFAIDDTPARADLLVDGDPRLPHDPAAEFVTG